jgi:endo-alpha-1,4-polygalactosaminidase (GH114 family)
MRLIKIILFVLPSILTANVLANGTIKNSILVCYGRLEPETIKGYSYVILESQYYTIDEVQKIKSQNEKVVAYISLGEVNANSKYFELLKANSYGKNEIWNSYYLNLKSEKAIENLMEMVKITLDFGYDGLFLDNIDNFTSFGLQSEQKAELINLLKAINDGYPNHIFIQNAGIEIIGETVPFVDLVMVESVASNYTFNDKNYKLREEKEFKNYINKLETVSNEFNLPIILIEYADTMALFNAIQRRIKLSKFDCFIGNIDLQTIPKFSK